MSTTITQINLLPWREERRAKRQQEFYVLLFVAFLLGALVWWLWQGVVQGKIDHQNTRNNVIQTSISGLDKKISEIRDIEQRRNELIDRMKVIQDLQGNRPSVVYVFDELVRIMPKGVYFTDIKRTNDVFTIEGVAETNNYISALMRNMSSSAWFGRPTLSRVSTLADGQRAFVLTVKQESPDSKEGEE